MERCGFGGEAGLLPGCPKVGSLLVPQCQAKPVIPKAARGAQGRRNSSARDTNREPSGPQTPPACPKGGGTVAAGPLQQDPSGHQFLLSLQMVSKLPLMKTICNLHLDKLEFFRLLHPETAMNFPPLYKEVFNSELQYSDPRES